MTPPLSEAAALFLTSPEGSHLLAEAAALPGDGPQRLLTLRKRGIAPEIAAGALAVAEARKRAASRFPDADRLFFTPDALAQATSPVLAAYHAGRLVAAGFRTVADLGCGVGMDALALAAAGLSVLAIERDPARLVFARANAEAHGLAERITFRQGDVTTLDWTADAAFWDPSRRTSGSSSPDGGSRRVSRHGDLYEPPLSFLEAIRAKVQGGCVKLSPALPDETLTDLGGRVEFLSERRECKEACLWFGAAQGAAGDSALAAVLLPSGFSLPRSQDADGPPAGPVGAYLFDPDPAAVRARALDTLATEMGGVRRLGAADAYLTGDTLPEGPARDAVSAYRILEAMPYHPGPVGAMLRGRGIDRLVVKKRHFPLEPDALARTLQLRRAAGGNEGTLVLVRTAAAPRPAFWAVLCEPVSSLSPSPSHAAPKSSHADL